MLEFLILVGFVSITNITYKLQLLWGNALYVMQYKNQLPRKLYFLRKIWWSEFDFYRDYDFEQAFRKAYKDKEEICLH